MSFEPILPWLPRPHYAPCFTPAAASGGFELNRPTFGVPLVKDLPPEDKAALEQRHPPHVVTSDEAPSEELLRVSAVCGHW